MIDVKGVRSAQPDRDPTDPLNLRKQEEGNGKALGGGMFGGILALGLYLRSFLWSEPQAAIAPEPAGPKGTSEDENEAAPRRTASLGFAEEQPAPEEETAEGEQEMLPPIRSPFPSVLGPFASLTFSPLSVYSIGTEAARGPANAILPPFNSFGVGSGPLKGSSLTSYDPPPANGGSGPVIARPIDGIDTPEDEDEEDDTPQDRTARHKGPVYLGDVGSGAAVAFALSYFLSQTTNPDGSPLTVTMGDSTSGLLEPRGEGWRYIADTEFLGEVRIDYTVTDGGIDLPQTAYLSIVPNFYEGGDGDDLIVGTHGRDDIQGHGGDDNLAGLAGHDTISGGAGDDNIAGGDGDDILTGGDGDDLIAGGGGNDVIRGGAGNDRLYGEEGNDEIHGEDGDDEAYGGAGDDVLSGGQGKDILSGGAGQDILDGGAGDDVVSGGMQDDLLHGGDGDDLLAGDEGDDEIHGGAGDDEADGGDGDDVIKGGLGDDVLTGGAGHDLLSGDEGRDLLSGGAGEDVLEGGAGDDVIEGGTGDDLLFGGAGDDDLHGDEGADVVSGGAGRDMLDGGDGDDVLSGGEDEDVVAGGAGDDLVIADDDDAHDHYDGGDDHDRLDYSAATESVSFDLEAGTASGASIGEDRFENFEALVGSGCDDTFDAGAGEAELTGNGGADLYRFVQGDTVDIIRSVYHITDFDDDDEIWIGSGSSHRQLRREQKSLEDRIEDGLEDYAEATGADEPRVSYHFDWTDTYRRTVIEVDFDRDKVVDLELVFENDAVFVMEQA